MSKNKRRVEGFDYLYQRGGSFEVRLQVPRPLRDAVGKGELKKSLGGDFGNVRREYHRTVADLQSLIVKARDAATTLAPLARRTQALPTREQITLACHAHFKRMGERIRGRAMLPVGKGAASRRERIEALQILIEDQIDLAETETFSAMSTHAAWLCEEHGWILDPSSSDFEYLCQTMLRARLQAYRDELRKLEVRYSTDPDRDPLFGAKPPAASKHPRTLGDLVAKFKSARSINWSGSTEKNYIIIFRVIEELCGSNTPLGEVDHDFCIEVRDKLLNVPSNYQKRPSTRGKPLNEVMKIAAREGLPRIKAATVNNHLNKLGAIVRYGRDQGWIVGNPMAGIEVKDDVSPEEKRDPFSTDQLNLIFASEPWVPGADRAGERPSRFWAPLIALYSGARLSEICGQLTAEMIIENEVRTFNFRHRPGEREIKNGKSRKVPVHPELIRLGFWDFVEEAKLSKRNILFPDVSRDRLGKWGDGTSKWFSRLIAKLGLEGANLSFHSFRHNFEDRLRDIDLHNTAIGNRITGRWTAGVSKNYGSQYTLVRLNEEMAKIGYEGLSLDHIGNKSKGDAAA
jgi:integrase